MASIWKRLLRRARAAIKDGPGSDAHMTNASRPQAAEQKPAPVEPGRDNGAMPQVETDKDEVAADESEIIDFRRENRAALEKKGAMPAAAAANRANGAQPVNGAKGLVGTKTAVKRLNGSNALIATATINRLRAAAAANRMNGANPPVRAAAAVIGDDAKMTNAPTEVLDLPLPDVQTLKKQVMSATSGAQAAKAALGLATAYYTDRATAAEPGIGPNTSVVDDHAKIESQAAAAASHLEDLERATRKIRNIKFRKEHGLERLGGWIESRGMADDPYIGASNAIRQWVTFGDASRALQVEVGTYAEEKISDPEFGPPQGQKPSSAIPEPSRDPAESNHDRKPDKKPHATDRSEQAESGDERPVDATHDHPLAGRGVGADNRAKKAPETAARTSMTPPGRGLLLRPEDGRRHTR
jgi:hypothetical protein